MNNMSAEDARNDAIYCEAYDRIKKDFEKKYKKLEKDFEKKYKELLDASEIFFFEYESYWGEPDKKIKENEFYFNLQKILNRELKK